jgi:hypothetical protein
MPVDLQAQECLCLDEEWRTLSWLCSDTGRAEERYEAAASLLDPAVFTSGNFVSALAAKVAEMGFKYVPPTLLQADPILTAIQGRREGDPGPTLDGLGLTAAILDPNEVASLSTALNQLDEDWIRARFDPDEMEALGMPVDRNEDELDTTILPLVARFKALYTRASDARQFVLVVME